MRDGDGSATVLRYHGLSESWPETVNEKRDETEPVVLRLTVDVDSVLGSSSSSIVVDDISVVTGHSSINGLAPCHP